MNPMLYAYRRSATYTAMQDLLASNIAAALQLMSCRCVSCLAHSIVGVSFPRKCG
jgi:hypothetical protein